MRHLLLAALLLCLWRPVTAHASASPMVAGPAPLPTAIVSGAAVVSDLRVSVTCAAEDEDGAVACDVVASFWVRPLDATGATVEVEGEPTVFVAGGERARLELRYPCEARPRYDDGIDPFVMSPMWARHVLLGEPMSAHWSPDIAMGSIVVGSITFEGTFEVVLDAPPNVTASFGGVAIDGSAQGPLTTSALTIRTDHPEPAASGPIQHGGPVLALGVRYDFARDTPEMPDEGRFLLGVGYELGLLDHFFVALALETDFDSIVESLVIEAATPEVLLIIPSLSVGAGVAARQLGPRDADAGLRLRASMNITSVGVVATFDYWPDVSDWTASMTVRLSL